MKKISKNLFAIIGLFLLGFGQIQASYLDQISNSKRDIKIGDGNNIDSLILTIANSIINTLFIIAIIYFFIITIKLIVGSGGDEDKADFKKGFIWTSIGLMVLKLAQVFVRAIYSPKDVDGSNISIFELGDFSKNLLENIVVPLTNLIETGAAFLFVLIAIYAFYRLITSNGEETAAKTGKMMIFYSIIGFIVIKVAGLLVRAVYGECKSTTSSVINLKCATRNPEISEIGSIITTIINWLNSFIGIGVIIMVIYVGLQIIFSKGDEEKLNSAKKSVLYIVIGIAILIMNYFILTFFLNV